MTALPSIMTHNFSQIPQAATQRSSFDRSHGHKTTLDASYLVPMLLEEILPGDTISMDATWFARVATMLNVPMDNIFLDTFWFFVPNRLVWENWQRFNGERYPNPDSSIDFLVPSIGASAGDGNVYQFQPFSLADYFGLPIGPLSDIDLDMGISSLPFRGYALIWNEWFRDQNLQEAIQIPLGDGPDYVANTNPALVAPIFNLLRRGKRHDYFSSALPEPQKGDSVPMPLGGTAPVVGDGYAMQFWNGSANLGMATSNGTSNILLSQGLASPGPLAGAANVTNNPSGSVYFGLSMNPARSHVYADLSLAVSATINQLREAFATQQSLELDARGGTRYVEQLRSRWGVTVPDFRLQRPEYLGGSSQRVDIRQVANTGGPVNVDGTPTSRPQASLASYGQIVTHSGFHHSFVEHGYLFCLVNVRADITYQGGIRRHWTRRDRYDFYMPEFAHLGEQPVYTRELFWDSSMTDNDQVFGYQERWAEYRYGVSHVTGAFRSNYPQSLDTWHLALDFDTIPELDEEFIQDSPPIDRIRAIQPETPDGQQFIVDSYYKFRHARLMPIYSIPGLNRL